MTIRRLATLALFVGLTQATQALAGQPVYPLSDACTMPTMPGHGSTREDWKTYSQLAKEYNACLGKKAEKYGEKTKEAIEGVGEKVQDLRDKAAAWFSK